MFYFEHLDPKVSGRSEQRGHGGIPGLQVPERGVVAEPGVGQLGRGHEGVVLRVLLRVADQTDRETKTGRSGRSQCHRQDQGGHVKQHTLFFTAIFLRILILTLTLT